MEAARSTKAPGAEDTEAETSPAAPVEDAQEPAPEGGQTTAEYALVLLGVAAIAAVLIKWATSASGLTRLFTAVLRKLVQGVAG